MLQCLMSSARLSALLLCCVCKYKPGPLDKVVSAITAIVNFRRNIAWFLYTFHDVPQALILLGLLQAERLRIMLTRLGPAFVKIGQVGCADSIPV